MPQVAPKIRLHVTAPLGSGAEISLPREQTHYLLNVMRQQTGDRVALFNGQDGEWAAEIIKPGKREAVLACNDQLRQQTEPPDLWLCFAPVKKARTDFIAEKACEMGCRRIVPVFTRFTNSDRVRTDRLAAHAIEAAEQCGLLSVPEIADPVQLDRLVSDWPPDRQMMFCDESGEGATALDVLSSATSGPWGILIGPEGGFAPEEAKRLRALDFATPVSLGPRILRADTAAVAALTLWQACLGDWQ